MKAEIRARHAFVLDVVRISPYYSDSYPEKCQIAGALCSVLGGDDMRLPRRMYERLKSAGVLKAELAVTAFCFLLPDLVDKPLWMLGIGMGRFVGHTLVLVFLVAFVFFLIKRPYGLFALVGGMSHLLSDAGTFMPWFYPFLDYDFPQLEFWRFAKWYMVVILLGQLAVLILLTMSVLLWLSSCRKKAGQGKGM